MSTKNPTDYDYSNFTKEQLEAESKALEAESEAIEAKQTDISARQLVVNYFLRVKSVSDSVDNLKKAAENHEYLHIIETSEFTTSHTIGKVVSFEEIAGTNFQIAFDDFYVRFFEVKNQEPSLRMKLCEKTENFKCNIHQEFCLDEVNEKVTTEVLSKDAARDLVFDWYKKYQMCLTEYRKKRENVLFGLNF